ncbi:hypothetical protein [Crocinitomix algicola]|uniref:hypothetical protein n=1 Tax=Crocinitomix algicola TaxID=1740263 RepID=UPI000872E9FD|nr:hypothetical protein [Crocinitomix algicola]
MRKLFIAGSALFFNSFLFSQVTLNKTVLTSNVEQIQAAGSGAYFSTSSDFYSYACGDVAETHLASSSVNEIFQGDAYSNDTLSVNEASSILYYGISNVLTDGTNSHNMYTPVNAITTDGDSVYTIVVNHCAQNTPL